MYLVKEQPLSTDTARARGRPWLLFISTYMKIAERLFCEIRHTGPRSPPFHLGIALKTPPSTSYLEGSVDERLTNYIEIEYDMPRI